MSISSLQILSRHETAKVRSLHESCGFTAWMTRGNWAQRKANAKRIYEFQLQRVRVYIVHSLSKPFPLLHRKWLGKTEISVYTETFVFGTIPCERHFSCVNLIFFLLWRHEWDVFTTICSLWPTGPAPRPIFLLNQTLLCSGTRTTLSAVGEKTTLPQRSPGQTSTAIFKRQPHVYWEKQTNLRKGVFFSHEYALCFAMFVNSFPNTF